MASWPVEGAALIEAAPNALAASHLNYTMSMTAGEEIDIWKNGSNGTGVAPNSGSCKAHTNQSVLSCSSWHVMQRRGKA